MAAIGQVSLSDAVTNNRFSAEFFDPKYTFKPKNPECWRPIGRILSSFEYGISIAMNSEGKGFPIFRMNEIDNCLAQRPQKYADIPTSLFERYRLKENDVLFNRTNSFDFVGRTGIVKDQTDCTFASYLIRLTPNPDLILPEFLTVYLNTGFGIGQIKRRAMRSINQANVSASEIRRVLIPLVDMQQQLLVAELLNQSSMAVKKAYYLFEQAEKAVEAELQLSSVKSGKPIGYITTFSELESSHRSDAQHFQPRFASLLDHITKFPTKRIRDIRSLNRRGIQPVYVEDGTHAVVNSQHLGPKHINYDGLQRTTEKLFNAAPEAHIRKDDLLIYTTGAYIGRTNVYLDDTPAFASNHVNILRLSPDIDHAYMAMVFQSVIGQFQTQKHARGSAQAELYPADIDKFIVPLLPSEKQREIGDLVRESLAQQRESARLLEQAKARVEQLIEEAVAA
jgi:restriction endonuclease S subunit